MSDGGTIQLKKGTAPASGAVRRASRLTVARQINPSFGDFPRRRCSARGAPNSSRGGCGPHQWQLHGFGLVFITLILFIWIVVNRLVFHSPRVRLDRMDDCVFRIRVETVNHSQSAPFLLSARPIRSRPRANRWLVHQVHQETQMLLPRLHPPDILLPATPLQRFVPRLARLLPFLPAQLDSPPVMCSATQPP